MSTSILIKQIIFCLVCVVAVRSSVAQTAKATPPAKANAAGPSATPPPKQKAKPDKKQAKAKPAKSNQAEKKQPPKSPPAKVKTQNASAKAPKTSKPGKAMAQKPSKKKKSKLQAAKFAPPGVPTSLPPKVTAKPAPPVQLESSVSTQTKIAPTPAPGESTPAQNPVQNQVASTPAPTPPRQLPARIAATPVPSAAQPAIAAPSRPAVALTPAPVPEPVVSSQNPRVSATSTPVSNALRNATTLPPSTSAKVPVFPTPVDSPAPTTSQAPVVSTLPATPGPVSTGQTESAAATATPTAPPSPATPENKIATNEAPAANATSVSAPLILNGIPNGQLELYLDEKDPQNPFIATKGFLEALKRDMKPDALQAVQAKVGSSDKLRANDFKAMQLDVVLKPETFVVEVSVPAELRQGQVLDFSAKPESAGIDELKKPVVFSGYTNIRSNKTFDTERLGRSGPDLPLRVQLENVQNLKGYFLESYVNYDEFSDYPWTRGDVRLSKDIERYAARATLGDFDMPFGGLQRSVPMRGLVYYRDFSIDPTMSVSPLTRNEFFLEAPARVEIFINENLFREVRLPAGRHHIHNLPVQAGINNIRLQITDDQGKVTHLVFPFISELELLDKGRQDFSYAIGQRRFFDGGEPRYDDDTAVGGFFHRWGATTNTTLGLNYQGDRHQYLAGGEITNANLLGTFALDGAGSGIRGGGQDGSGQLRYRSHSIFGSTLRLSALYLGRYFAPLGILAPNNPYDYTVGGNVITSLGGLFSLGVGTTYRFHRDKLGDSTTSFVNVSKYFKNRLNVSVQLSRTREPIGTNDDRVFVILQWSDTTASNFGLATHESESGNTRVDFTHAPKSKELGATAGVVHNDGIQQVDAGLLLTKPRGEFEARQSFFGLSSDVPGAHQQRLRLTARTAIAYTLSGIGFSKTITDSFALVKPTGRLKGQTIEINPIEFRPQAVADKWGPGILSSLRSYSYQSVNLQTADPMAAAMLPADNILVRPTARSGTDITLEGLSAIMLSGRLKTTVPKAPPLTLLTGSIQPLNAASEAAPNASTANKEQTMYFFTNEEGQFFLESVPPGKYRLQLDYYKGDVVIEVPESAFGPYDLGDIVFDKERIAQ